MEAEALKAKRMFILDQLKQETDPAKRAIILLDCPYYYFVPHYLDIRDNLTEIGCDLEQAYFSALIDYLKATGERRETLWETLITKQAALKAVTMEAGA